MKATALLFVAMCLAARAESYQPSPHSAALAWARQHGAENAEVWGPSDLTLTGAGEVDVWGFACARPPAGHCAAVSNQIAAAAWLNAQPVVKSIGTATVKTYSDGTLEITGPLVVQGATNGAYEITVDPGTGLVFGELDHASPRKSQAERDAAKAARRAKIAAVKAAQSRNEKMDALLDLLGLK